MRKELNKWQFIFRHAPDHIRMYDQAWRYVDIAFVKFISFPPEGALIEKANYKGIWIKFAYWFPKNPVGEELKMLKQKVSLFGFFIYSCFKESRWTWNILKVSWRAAVEIEEMRKSNLKTGEDK